MPENVLSAPFLSLFVAQRVNRVQSCRSHRGQEAKRDSHRRAERKTDEGPLDRHVDVDGVEALADLSEAPLSVLYAHGTLIAHVRLVK